MRLTIRIEQNVTISVQQSPDRQPGRHTGLPLPNLLIRNIPVGADLCVRPSVWARLYNFFVLHPTTVNRYDLPAYGLGR